MDEETKHKIARHMAALMDEVLQDYERRIAELEAELEAERAKPTAGSRLRRENERLRHQLRDLVAREVESQTAAGGLSDDRG